MKKQNETRTRRTLERQLARELSEQEMRKVQGAGGTTSCSACQADDCDVRLNQY